MEEFSYIVLDLEWNQPMSGQETITRPFRFELRDHRDRGAEAEQPI